MNKSPHNFDWADLAFGSKKAINGLNATFIAAPREISPVRFTQLVKTYLPKGNIVVGIAKEEYIAGFENQPQFKTLRRPVIQTIIDKVNTSPSPHKIFTLGYFQREAKHLFEKLDFSRVILINGSWKYSFHTLENYYALVNRGAKFEMTTPFCDEAEARRYENKTFHEIEAMIPMPSQDTVMQEPDLLDQVQAAAKLSFDYSNQTGVVLAKKTTGNSYIFLDRAYNRVVPFQTYAMHYGAARERHFSPPNDLNHYDTVHAEVEMLIQAQKNSLDLNNSSLFINVLPCPPCSRMLAETTISEIIYIDDHSSGYAVQMLELSGKKVRRI